MIEIKITIEEATPGNVSVKTKALAIGSEYEALYATAILRATETSAAFIAEHLGKVPVARGTELVCEIGKDQ